MARYEYPREVYVDPYPGREDSEILWDSPCSRCVGDGGFQYYVPVNGGVCFRCDGDPDFREIYRVSNARKAEKSRVRSTNRARLAQAKHERFVIDGLATLAQTSSEWGTLTPGEGLLDPDHGNEFLLDLVDSLGKHGTLTARQIAAGENAIRREITKVTEAETRAAKLAVAPAIEAGRYEVEGRVISTKFYEAYHPGGSGTVKMLVEDDLGRRFFGTAPGAIVGYGLQGRRVKFTATMSPAEDDQLFAKFSRPSKAELITNENEEI